MTNFLTYKTELIQSEADGIWITAHNQLFQDYDGIIYLVPRFFKTDGYTISNVLAPIGGNRMEYDIRPAVQHDWDCKYRFSLIVKLTDYELRQKGLLRTIWKQIGEDRIQIEVCDDIPIKYLKVVPMRFKETNLKFKRMLDCIKGMEGWRKKMIASAVFLNIGWLIDKPSKFNVLDLYNKKM